MHGRLRETVSVEGDTLVVGQRSIRLTAIRNPEDLPWGDVDIAYECTGLFTARDQAARLLQSGSKRVLISAPGKDADRTVVFGVNHTDLTAEDVIVSNASCTTNCLAPVAMVLHRAFGIKTGYMTTIHAFTGDQPATTPTTRTFTGGAQRRCRWFRPRPGRRAPSRWCCRN